ncbi:MAG: peptidoglycan-binding protein [Coriobacteriia bacterium]|nr:peptidoglycan-binding protein [Coriobacteriia bacterium]
MAKWSPFIVKGDFQARAAAAKRGGAVCYYAQHFNSGGGHYTMTEVASNASATSKAWGRNLAARFAKSTGIPSNGCRQIPAGGRGNACLVYTAMPAVLGEVVFIDDHSQDEWAETHIDVIAKDVADSIMAQFPGGGPVALDIGHAYKTSSPNDTGASDHDKDANERTLNTRVINRVAEYLNAGNTAGVPAPTPTPQPKPTHPAHPLLKRGSTGSAVRHLQQRLVAHGFKVAVDGDFGPNTQAAVHAFQHAHRLTADSIVGPNTWRALCG